MFNAKGRNASSKKGMEGDGVLQPVGPGSERLDMQTKRCVSTEILT